MIRGVWNVAVIGLVLTCAGLERVHGDDDLCTSVATCQSNGDKECTRSSGCPPCLYSLPGGFYSCYEKVGADCPYPDPVATCVGKAPGGLGVKNTTTESNSPTKVFNEKPKGSSSGDGKSNVQTNGGTEKSSSGSSPMFATVALISAACVAVLVVAVFVVRRMRSGHNNAKDPDRDFGSFVLETQPHRGVAGGPPPSEFGKTISTSGMSMPETAFQQHPKSRKGSHGHHRQQTHNFGDSDDEDFGSVSQDGGRYQNGSEVSSLYSMPSTAYSGSEFYHQQGRGTHNDVLEIPQESEEGFNISFGNNSILSKGRSHPEDSLASSFVSNQSSVFMPRKNSDASTIMSLREDDQYDIVDPGMLRGSDRCTEKLVQDGRFRFFSDASIHEAETNDLVTTFGNREREI